MTGSVVICAASVKSRYSATGWAMRRARFLGRRRASRLVNQRCSGSAYSTSPSVAMNESWKLGSQGSQGLNRHISAAVKVRLLTPACLRPINPPNRPTAPMMAARTTGGEPPTSRVYAPIHITAPSAAVARGRIFPSSKTINPARMAMLKPEMATMWAVPVSRKACCASSGRPESSPSRMPAISADSGCG